MLMDHLQVITALIWRSVYKLNVPGKFSIYHPAILNQKAP